MSFGIPVRNGLAIGLLSSTFLSTRRALPPPTLALNFLAGAPLDSRVTFTRSTTATFVGSNGLIQSSAINAPRFDYDPVTLAPRGLLIEEPRTNLLLNSDILGTNLSTQSVTVTAQSYTLSFYGTGTITLSGAAVQIVTGTGAYPSRRTLTFIPIAGVLICTVTGTVQFAQLEAGAFATSFIPTAASPVTRAADTTVMTGTNFSSWYNQSQGTLVISSNQLENVTSLGIAYAISDDTFGNSMFGNYSGGNSFRGANLVVGGAGQTNSIPSFTVTNVAVPLKDAFAYAVDNFGNSTNGQVTRTDNFGSVNTASNRMYIGLDWSGSGNYINGHIRFITFYSLRLTDAQLQAVTA